MADFTLTNHGSVAMLTPLTEAAKDWCGEFLPDDVQMMGNAVAIEPRYVQPIIDGIMGDGLTVD